MSHNSASKCIHTSWGDGSKITYPQLKSDYDQDKTIVPFPLTWDENMILSLIDLMN